eukprot:GHUV01034538.1.p1 GENE.GHUV01034538.1~~GHUV01034538.1.p1  ORF type:complete len:388 (+),score=55.61 GHUV01034538.1:197-1360(+)
MTEVRLAHVWPGILLILSGAVLSAHGQASFQDCGAAVDVSSTCIWRPRQAVQEQVVISGTWYPSQGGFPALMVDGAEYAGRDKLPAVRGGTHRRRVLSPPTSWPCSQVHLRHQSLSADFTLSLRRLVLVNVTLAPPGAAGQPALWPEQMYTAPATGLTMSDVRIIASADDFWSYLNYFQSNNTEARYFTDGVGCLHIAAWDHGSTSVHSVTLVSGPCTPQFDAMYLRYTTLLSSAAAASGGKCAISADINNVTLIPALLQEGAKNTSQPLLVLVTANVSLGVGLGPGAVSIRRPVIMVGLYTIPTSVDFGMVVNQLVGAIRDQHCGAFRGLGGINSWHAAAAPGTGNQQLATRMRNDKQLCGPELEQKYKLRYSWSIPHGADLHLYS